MFLHTLTDSQQAAFLALAQHFIAADEELSGEEHNQLELAMAEVGWDFDEQVPDHSIDEAARFFDTPTSRKVALLELIGIGHADNEFHPHENDFVRRLAAGWGVADPDVDRMEKWVQSQLALAMEAAEILAA